MLRALFLSLLCAACHPNAPRYPWAGAEAESAPKLAQHNVVRTLNSGYSRVRSRVLVREVSRPTRAALDYAAYHANFLIAGDAPEAPPPELAEIDARAPFSGTVSRETLTANVRALPLSATELGQALAFAPLSEYLLARGAPGADELEELGAAVHRESWGGESIAGMPSQTISEVYIRRSTEPPELWVKIEFAPWFHGLGSLPDGDRDGYPELYARARLDRASEALVAAIDGDYAGRALTAAELRTWANELSSYWYPSFNTDLVSPGDTWPDPHTEPEILHELAGLRVSHPSVVMRGKPRGEATYVVLVVPELSAPTEVDTGDRLVLTKTSPSPTPAPAAAAIRDELARSGAASWRAWSEQLASFSRVAQKHLSTTPAPHKGLPGLDDFLFYRSALEYTISGDLEDQPAGKNPLPAIVEWQRELARLGVDFLFVPVPAKEEIFPDKLDSALSPLVGKVINPWERKLIVSLADEGVEVLDLLAPLLAARSEAASEPLYQRQDTHWSARGLELAARLISARIKRYPWYPQLAAHKRTFDLRDASFTRFGDLHSRLPEGHKKRYRPETLQARQVVDPDGKPYEDDASSPIVILGDSFTGVYQLTDAEHAGLSAHIAREIGYPVDLVMSYGGGPNVRRKLLRRGEAELEQKQLVVWVMADRDLFNYWEDWEPLNKP